jgi:hypothetical protein
MSKVPIPWVEQKCLVPTPDKACRWMGSWYGIPRGSWIARTVPRPSSSRTSASDSGCGIADRAISPRISPHPRVSARSRGDARCEAAERKRAAEEATSTDSTTLDGCGISRPSPARSSGSPPLLLMDGEQTFPSGLPFRWISGIHQPVISKSGGEPFFSLNKWHDHLCY